MEILIPDIGVARTIAPLAVVCAFLRLAFLLAGQLHLGRMTALNLPALLVISNAMQHALIVGNDTSLGGGLIG